MTTVFTRTVQGPALHVLVIGVGRYPHCGPEASFPPARGIGDLPGAARTAESMARWLVAEQTADPALPLASLELAISGDRAGSALRWDTGSRSVTVEGATRDHVTACFAAWLERCTGEDDVALLYFCGHGLASEPTEQILLLEGFGTPHDPFGHAVDLYRTYAAMRSCPAATQLFLIDACRLSPSGADPHSRFDALVPVPPGWPLWRTSELVLHSASFGQPAYAPADGDTHFSRAVREAFAGAAARQGDDGVWRVTTAHLGAAVADLMAHREATPPQRPEIVLAGSPGGTVLRVLPGTPEVPFQVRCAPDEAQPEADLSLVRPGAALATRHRPPGSPERWRGTVPVSSYDVRLHFPGGGWQDELREDWTVYPPCRTASVPVRRTEQV
ncbi:caspase family protein [Streptomyces sp. JJ38]|uniref:caspase family protein n=1 Tax=Streptomyces sp. JJ38 TaxID=2738128 RepID=UPI001C5950ED|nr:caspase family protein [Streptomyces sp. JJ38]MBW1596711.1 hypothetical protein [Streptomyces sp. JJ38]